MEKENDIIEDLNFEEEFRRLREKNKINSSLTKSMILATPKQSTREYAKDYHFDVRYVEFDRDEYLENKHKITEEEYIKSIKDINLFYFDDFVKMNEDLIKEVLTTNVDFQLNCFFMFDYSIKSGRLFNYNEDSQIITLKMKNDIEFFVDYKYHYVYGRIHNNQRKTEFRKRMELFLKCKSIVVKRRMNNKEHLEKEEQFEEDKNNKKKIKEDYDSEESDACYHAQALAPSEDNYEKREEEYTKVLNDVLKLNLQFEENRKIDLINSILNREEADNE